VAGNIALSTLLALLQKAAQTAQGRLAADQ